MSKLLNVKFGTYVFRTTKDNFQHINSSERLETIECVFDGCEFKTNICYATHTSRKHQSYLCKDLKADVIVKLLISTSVRHHDSQFAFDVELDATVDLDCESYQFFLA